LCPETEENIHNVATALLAHDGNHRLHAIHRAKQVGIEHSPELGHVHVGDARHINTKASVVPKNIDAPEPGDSEPSPARPPGRAGSTSHTRRSVYSRPPPMR